MTLPAETMAVVVGIEKYQAGETWWLKGPALDACRFAHWLTVRGVAADRISLLVSPHPDNAGLVAEKSQGYGMCATADHATIRDVFTRYLPGEKSGLLILYWGGHGIIEHEERRLIYADATAQDKKNLNLSSLLRSMRSQTFAGHPRQLGLVDACMNLVSQLGWEGSMPDEAFAIGQPDPRRDQRVLLAASPGESATNLDAMKTGLFSQVLREELNALPADTWPPDADRLRDMVNERFQHLREDHRTQQVPSCIWFLSRSDEDTLMFASGTAAGRAVSAAIGGQLLTFAEHRKLKAILDGAPAPKALRALYREATRDVTGLGLPRWSDDLMSTIEALRGPLSAMPLFRFLVHFSAGTDSVTRKRLWEWINEVAPHWGVDVGELEALNIKLHRTFILVRLEPDLLGDGFLVTGWTYEGAYSKRRVTTSGPCNRDRLAAEVGLLIDGYDPVNEPATPVIEFLVPLVMLDDDLEALRVRIAGRDRELGINFPVVVRSLDRLVDSSRHECWRAMWDELTARGDAYDEDAICWVEHAAPDGRFNPSSLGARVCTALAYARPRWPHEDPVLQAALSAGSPVALWHRASGVRGTRRAALEEVLRNRGLRDLPDVVFNQRIAAHHPDATADHAGRDLVLLWDSPERVPADLEWHPPTVEGVAL